MTSQSKSPKPASNFRDDLAELEKITTALESDDVDLTQAIDYFARGTELATSLQDQLNAAELKIQSIRQKFSDVSTGDVNQSDKI